MLDDRLNDTTLYTAADKTELQNLLKQQAELASKLENAEERWLILQEQLEAMPAID
jgi:ATP-binding cassette subfamily F protein 3